MKRTFGAVAGLVLLLTGTEARSQEAAPVRVNIAKKFPLSVGLRIETGAIGSSSYSKVFELIASKIDPDTNLDIAPLEEKEMDRCFEAGRAKGRLTCLVEASSPPWRNLVLSRVPPTFAEVEEEIRKGAKVHASLLLLISASEVEGKDRVVGLLIDVDDAIKRAYPTYRTATDGKPNKEELEAIEEVISQSSVVATSGFEEVTDVEQYLARLMTVLEPTLKKRGHWKPNGYLRVEVKEDAKFEVDVGGRSESLTDRVLEIEVEPGTHEVKLVNAEFLPFETTVEVKQGESTILQADVRRTPNQVNGILQSTLMWTGIGLTAVGVGIVIASIAVPKPLTDTCFSDPGSTTSCREGGVFYRFGDGTPGLNSPNGGGPPMAPLGYSLGGAGLAWMLGPLIDDDPDRTPWLEFVIGAAVFGLSYGISVALDNDPNAGPMGPPSSG